MSRIGKKPITIPAGVEVTLTGKHIVVKGPKGTLERDIHPDVDVKVENGIITVSVSSESNGNLHGLTRTLINNMVEGVEKEFKRDLEINGVGYRAQKQGNKLVLNMGFSHPIEFEERDNLTIEVPSQTSIIVKGIDKEKVGQLCAEIRKVRPPEPYKGKGIKYVGERIIRKEGKVGKK